MVVANPFSTGAVNVKSAYAAASKPSLDAWGTLYRCDGGGISDPDAAAASTGGSTDGDVVIKAADDYEAFRSSIGRWLEGYSLGRLGSRGGQRAGTALADDDGVAAPSTSAASPSLVAAGRSEAVHAATPPSTSTSTSTSTSSHVDLPELIIVFGGDGTINGVVDCLHSLEAEAASALPAVPPSAGDVPATEALQAKQQLKQRQAIGEAVFATAVMPMPCGMSNGLAASIGTTPFVESHVFAARAVGGEIARAMEAAAAQGRWSAGAADGGEGSNPQKEEPADEGDAAAAETAFTKAKGSSRSSVPKAPLSIGAAIRKTAGQYAEKRAEQRRAAERRRSGMLQPARIVRRLPCYAVSLRPTGEALTFLREDAARTRRNTSSSSSAASEGGDNLFTTHVGYCMGGISAGMWASVKIKAHMLASLGEAYPGLPSLGPRAALDFATLREAVRAAPFPMSVCVGRSTTGWGEAGKMLQQQQQQPFPSVHPLPFSAEDCNVGFIEGPFTAVTISALPCQGYGLSLTPAAVRGAWAGDNGLSIAAAEAAGGRLSGEAATAVGGRSLFPFSDRISVTTADASVSAMRLIHLLVREARRNGNADVSAQCSAVNKNQTVTASSPTSSAESMRYNPPSWYGVDTSRILREDGVDVYGGGRLNSSGGGSEEEAAEGEAVGLDVDAPFTMAGLRNDADVPLVAMVDGMPVKVPPHFILEMKPTGRALTLWA